MRFISGEKKAFEGFFFFCLSAERQNKTKMLHVIEKPENAKTQDFTSFTSDHLLGENLFIKCVFNITVACSYAIVRADVI